MVHGKLLPFVTKIEKEKTIFQRNNAPIYTATAIKIWFQDFGLELLSMASIEFWSEYDREPMENSSERSLRLGQATSRKYRGT